MGNTPNVRPEETELVFLGRIGADFSHEVRNTLSIIGEYAGLLSDLLASADKGTMPDLTKLKGLSAKIKDRVKQGTVSMEEFSRFAHGAIEQTACCDLTALVGSVATIAQRRAASARCKLELSLPDQMIPVAASPLTLQHAVFLAIESMLEFQEKGTSVAVEVVPGVRAAVITVSCPPSVARSELSDRVLNVTKIMERLRGSADFHLSGVTCSLTLAVPTQ